MHATPHRTREIFCIEQARFEGSFPRVYCNHKAVFQSLRVSVTDIVLRFLARTS
jgi:hypothetical protein